MNLDVLNDLLQEILNCACTALESGICEPPGSDCGCPCRTYISFGPPVWDNCCEGQLTVHIDRIYQTSTFPQQTNTPTACGSELAAEIVVTLLRCWPATLNEDGTAPNKDVLQAAAEKLNQEYFLLSKAVICCLAAKGKSRPFVFGGSRPLGPQGGCSGVEVRFTVPVY